MRVIVKVCKKHGKLTQDECFMKTGRLKEHLYLQCRMCRNDWHRKNRNRSKISYKERYEASKKTALDKSAEENRMYSFVTSVFNKLTIARVK